jgi:hypothetical protein
MGASKELFFIPFPPMGERVRVRGKVISFPLRVTNYVEEAKLFTDQPITLLGNQVFRVVGKAPPAPIHRG